MSEKSSEVYITDKPRLTYEGLLEGNKKFVESMTEKDPEYFEKLSKGQKPPILWIGCADSRVPADKITNTNPGEIFVHRNIANIVVHTDMNMLSVLDYAVNVLKVEHVIVVGHYGCGGVLAAMSSSQHGIIDNWLRHIKDIYRLHAEELDAIEDQKKRGDRLVELNVIENAGHLTQTSIIQDAWERGQNLAVHGWVYSLETGYIQDLNVTSTSGDNLGEVFKFAYGK